jgi:hypothetical protein
MTLCRNSRSLHYSSERTAPFKAAQRLKSTTNIPPNWMRAMQELSGFDTDAN